MRKVIDLQMEFWRKDIADIEFDTFISVKATSTLKWIRKATDPETIAEQGHLK